MRNIVVLKDLPSNIVEEAIIVLKENQKLKKVELVDAENNKSREPINSKINKKDLKDYYAFPLNKKRQ